MSFVHLHNHSHYSFLDGLSKPEDIVLTAKEQGCPAVALTDHGVMHGAVEFYKVAKKHGVKPIIGCEMYIAEDRHLKDNTQKKANHLLLLAKDEAGYKNLLKLVTKAHLEGFYYRPRIDHKLLEEHSSGLIATSTCLAGEIPQALLDNDTERVKKKLNYYREVFDDGDFYLEVQDHPGMEMQTLLNQRIYDLAGKTGLKLVATNDCHYVRAADRDAHDILVCLQTGKTIHDENRMKYTSNFSLKSPQEMLAAFKDHPDAVHNTLEVAEKVNLELKFGQNLLPHFPTPDGIPAAQYLRKLCEAGLERLYTGAKAKKAAYERLDYELKIISQMGFDDYFLIVWDFIKFARENGIVVGPGRGSAAGSIIAYVLGITALDPLAYGLLFERFLNPERISMPDIDIDFADHRRDEILEYVKKKYGEHNVAQVITFGTMAAKAAVRDVGRAMGYPYSEVDEIAKKMPPPVLGKHPPLADSIKNHPELKFEYAKNKRAAALLDNAVKLEGTVRHAGTHACAVIICEHDLSDFTPLQIASGKDDTLITQYSMKPLEDIGLLKMDFLGLRNLTILETALNIIKERHDVEINLEDLPLDDKSAFELLAQGKTTGVFQLESGGMKRYLKDLKPTQLGDIIAMNALYRPGPMEYIPDYINGKHKPETVKYMDPSFEKILNETYGVCVYQEQLLEIARVFAGFSLGEADILRKAVGKKDPVLLAEQRQKFIDGAVEQGQDKKFAEKIFKDVIEPFAGYGFNKSHAACYALIAYQTAYLKAHYPTEFLAALLTADQGNTDRVVIDLIECKVMDVEVLPPSVNQSNVDFTVVEDGVIRFGLAAIKGVGAASLSKIIEERDKNGPYKTLEDFAKRVPKKLLNKKTLESLAYSGALDELGDRLQIAEGYDIISTYAKAEQDRVSDGQMDLFGNMDESVLQQSGMKLELPVVPKASEFQLLKWEKQYLGLYVSSHPLKGLGKYFKTKADLVYALGPSKVSEDVTVGGLVTETRKIITKKGDAMMIIQLEDPSGTIECIAFPKVYATMADLLVEDKVVFIKGKLEQRRDLQVVIREAKSVSLPAMRDKAKADGIYDPDEVFLPVTETEADEEAAPLQAETKKVVAKEQSTTDGGKIVDFPVNQSELDASILELKKHDPDFVFQVFVPHGTEPGRLQKLKGLIKDNPGEIPIELQLQGEDKKVQKLRLQGGIELSRELAAKFAACLT